MTEVDTRDYDYDLACLLVTEDGAREIIRLRPNPEWVYDEQIRTALVYVYERHMADGRVPTQEELLHDLEWSGIDLDEPEVEADWVIDKLRDRYLDEDLTVTLKRISRIKEPPRDVAKEMIAEATRLLREGKIRGEGEIVVGLDGVMEGLDRRHADPPASFGFDELDAAFGGGMHKDELYFVGARPGNNKTWLLLNSAMKTRDQLERNVAFFTLELSVIEMQARYLAMATGTGFERVQQRQKSSSERERLAEAEARNVADPHNIIFIPTPPGERTVPQMIEEAKAIDACAVYIDQFYDMNPTEKIGSRNDNEWRASIVHEMKNSMAKHFPVMVATQLRRPTEKAKSVWDIRVDNVALTDAIGQKSDIVFVSHRNKGMRDSNIFQLGACDKVRSYPPRAWEIVDEIKMVSRMRVDHEIFPDEGE